MKAGSALVPMRVMCLSEERKCLQPNCLWPKHTGTTPGIMDNTRHHNAVETQRTLHSVDMFPWPVRSPYPSQIEHVGDIIGRQPQRHPQPALTIPVLTKQVQQAWIFIP
ncbi:HTH_Tnp_Tc3_2 domain-containing protein [Trichonephila clavipes]|nr:HTH_Tnp_Tc3_2 domain-containing protein [Trichonephila clavipes]